MAMTVGRTGALSQNLTPTGQTQPMELQGEKPCICGRFKNFSQLVDFSKVFWGVIREGQSNKAVVFYNFHTEPPAQFELECSFMKREEENPKTVTRYYSYEGNMGQKRTLESIWEDECQEELLSHYKITFRIKGADRINATEALKPHYSCFFAEIGFYLDEGYRLGFILKMGKGEILFELNRVLAKNGQFVWAGMIPYSKYQFAKIHTLDGRVTKEILCPSRGLQESIDLERALKNVPILFQE